MGGVIGTWRLDADIPILLAWLVAAQIHIATGAGIVVPVIDMIPGVNRELLVLDISAGSLIFSHVNEAGFWLVKPYINMAVTETFQPGPPWKPSSP
ncbi:transporter, gluconate:H+ symporter (GntP) family [compost metagenome]